MINLVHVRIIILIINVHLAVRICVCMCCALLCTDVRGLFSRIISNAVCETMRTVVEREAGNEGKTEDMSLSTRAKQLQHATARAHYYIVL